MSYTDAVRDFLEREDRNGGLLIIQKDGTWVHFPTGYALDLVRYADADKPAEALLETASDLDQLKSP